MRLWPYLLDLTVRSAEGEQPVHIWLPLFIFWPLLALLALIAFSATVLVDLALAAAAQPYHHYTLLVFRSLSLLSEARGLVVRVHEGRGAVDMTLY